MNYEQISLEHLLDSLPQNVPLYKDSGLWMFRSDNMEEVICTQGANESFRDFVIRYFKTFENDENVMQDLAIKMMYN